jgi:hypothetical protein
MCNMLRVTCNMSHVRCNVDGGFLFATLFKHNVTLDQIYTCVCVNACARVIVFASFTVRLCSGKTRFLYK